MENKIPEGFAKRDDGCLCPDEDDDKGKIEEAPPPRSALGCTETCPYDPRFPNTNVTKRCALSFIDYQRCVRLLGDYPGCNYFLRCYRSLCPSQWIERWFTQMENGTFPYAIYPKKPIIYPPAGNPPCEEEAGVDDDLQLMDKRSGNKGKRSGGGGDKKSSGNGDKTNDKPIC